MVDCLEYAVNKENEIPRLIDLIFKRLSSNDKSFSNFNKKMRSAEEILKDYGLS